MTLPREAYSAELMVPDPPGFEYGYSLDDYNESGWDDYLFEGGSEPRFARSYATVNDREDRATLVELLHNGALGPDPVSSAEALRANYPYLGQKLDIMAEAVREVFGFAYWEARG